MQEINIDALTSEISETYYHKRIKKELREKHLKAEALKKQTETDPLNAFKLADEPISNISKKDISSQSSRLHINTICYM